MTKREMIDYCLTYPGVYEDYPFDEEWAVMRHSGSRKAFAFIYKRNGRPCVNLKCDPMQSDFLRSVYAEVQPAYHMNKVHWNTVLLDGTLPEEELSDMVEQSFRLTQAGKSTRKNKKSG